MYEMTNVYNLMTRNDMKTWLLHLYIPGSAVTWFNTLLWVLGFYLFGSNFVMEIEMKLIGHHIFNRFNAKRRKK